MEGPEEGKLKKKSEHLDVKLEGYSNSLWRLKGVKSNYYSKNIN